VTEVISVIPKTHYAFWRRRVGEQEADAKTLQAQTFGTAIHTIAAHMARGKPFTYGVDYLAYMEAINDFMRLHVAEAIEVERELVSEKHRFGGTLDLYCRLTDGSYAVVDWKTTSSLTREHGLQVAAYALLCREQGWTVNKRLVVRIKKDAPGKWYARTYGDHRGDVEAFLALKTYWHWLNRSKLERRAA
jgi:predicted RecB family nuclease